MLEVLDIQNPEEIVKLEEEVPNRDPVSENMSMLNQEAVKAFDYQDHESHMAVHMAALEDPKLRQIIGQSPFASQIQAAFVAHITEHVAFQYRRQVEEQLGVPLPRDENLPEDVERSLSPVVAKAAQKLLRKDQAEFAQQEAQKKAADPLTQIQQRELALKEAEFQHKKSIDLAKLEAETQLKQKTQRVEAERIASQERIEGARLGVKIADTIDERSKKETLEGVKIGMDIARQGDSE
jgi:hypothetical protein